jgi:hypothetical protein
MSVIASSWQFILRIPSSPLRPPIGTSNTNTPPKWKILDNCVKLVHKYKNTKYTPKMENSSKYKNLRSNHDRK